MDAELREAFKALNDRLDGVDKRLAGVDKRLDGVDKRLDGVAGIGRTALEETRNLARVVSILSDDNRTYAAGLAQLLGATADNSKIIGELSERLHRFTQAMMQGRSADTERWQEFDKRLASLEKAVVELQARPSP